MLFWHFPQKAKEKIKAQNEWAELEDELVFSINRLQNPSNVSRDPRVVIHRFGKMSSMVCSKAVILLCSGNWRFKRSTFLPHVKVVLAHSAVTHCSTLYAHSPARSHDKQASLSDPTFTHMCWQGRVRWSDQVWGSSRWNQPRLFTSKPKLKEDAVNV